MASSLATQLADLAARNPNAGRLQSARSLKSQESYLFGARQAASQSFDDVFKIGQEGLEGLVELDPAFEAYRATLFGEAARTKDRLLLPREETDKLDEVLERFLRDVGPHILVRPSATALEWLIRRFRINHFNVHAVAAAFLPYYATPQFASMLHILHLEAKPELSWLLPVQATRNPMPQQHLIDSLVKSTEALRFVANILPSVLETQPKRVHRALVGFHLSTLLGVFDALAMRKRKSTESAFSPSVIGIILPVMRTGVKASDNTEVQLASYVLTSAFVQRARPSPEVIEALVKVVAHSRPKTPLPHSRRLDGGWTDCDEALVRALVVLYQVAASDGIAAVPPLTTWCADSMVGIVALDVLIEEISSRFGTASFWTAFSRALIDGAHGGQQQQSALLLRFAGKAQLRTDLATSLLDSLVIALSSLDVPSESLVRALSLLAQRHPEALESSARALSASQPDRKLVVDRLVSLVTLVEGGSSAPQSKALALHSASDVTREAALVEILEDAAKGTRMETEEEDKLLEGAVRRALADPKPAVAQLLLIHADVAVGVLEPSVFFDISRATLASEDTPRATLKAHLSLLCRPFFLRHPSLAGRIATELVLPRLLVTKGGAKATNLVWSILADTDAKFWGNTALEGVNALKSPGEGSEERLRSNEALVDLLSHNVSKYPALVDQLISTLWSVSAAGKILAMLTLWIAAPQLGPVSSVAAIRFLLGPSALDAAAKGASLAATELSDQDLTEVFGFAYSKTTSPKTFTRAAVGALLALASHLAEPSGVAFTWFEGKSAPQNDFASSFKETVRYLFRLASQQEQADHSALGTKLAVAIRGNVVSKDSLAFFASIWTSPLQFGESVRCAAFRAAAYVVASLQQDFQLLLPSILIGLSGSSRAVRQAALDLLHSIGVAYGEISDASPAPQIYGYQQLYGQASSQCLQYLETSDASVVVGALLAAREELLLDGSFVETVLEDHLGARDTQVGKKAAVGLKHSMLCFVLSHVSCLDDIELRCKLLGCVERVGDPLRATATAPLVEELLAGKAAICDSPPPALEEYAARLMVCYACPPKGFAKGKDPSYQLLLRMVETEGATPARAALRTAAVARLEQGLMQILNAEQQVQLLYRLIQLGSSDRLDASTYISALRSLVTNASVFVALVAQIGSTVGTMTSRSQKKAKTSTSATATHALQSHNLIELSLLLENTSIGSMDPTPAVLGSLINTLRTLNEASTHALSDTYFAAQLVVAALVDLAPRAREHPSFDPSSLQLGPVVDYMRTCPNPYLAQQAILFIAELAPAAPDQVLQSVMPIFTFVGVNVLQRDDAASARTVQRVIEALVPPLLASAKQAGGDRVSVIHGVRELLLAFVEASGHIPRHRRLRLFVRLVQTLGPYEFLAASIVLLLDRDADSPEANADLSLALWEAFSSELGIAALAHILSEVENLMKGTKNALNSILAPRRLTFGDGDTAMADSNDANRIDTERTQVLLEFIKSALGSRSLASKLDADRSRGKIDSDAVLSHFIQMTADVVQRKEGPASAKPTQDAARNVAYNAAALVSLDAFSVAVLRLIKSSDQERTLHGLDLLRSRLISVKAARREQLEGLVRSAIQICQHELHKAIDGNAAQASNTDLLLALDTLVAIAVLPAPGELNSMTSVFPTLLRMAQHSQDKIAVVSIKVAREIAPHLGSRMIPHINLAVQTSVSLMHRATEMPVVDLVRASFELLAAVVRAAPAFMSPHLSILLSLVADARVSSNSGGKQAQLTASRSTFVSTLVKCVKLPDIVPEISQTWAGCTTSEAQQALLDLLRQSIKVAKPAEVASSSKAVFAFLLQAFDMRRLGHFPKESSLPIENAALDVFMVLILKLNEATFKPLLLRTVDWAVIDSSSSDEKIISDQNGRSIVLFKLFHRMLTQLKSIGLPFVAYVLDKLATTLETLASSSNVDLELWDEVMAVLQKSFEHDSIGFWTHERLVKLTEAVTRQLDLAPTLLDDRPDTRLIPLVRRLASAVSPHDTLVKVLVAGLLRGVRSGDLLAKRASINALDVVWQQLGPALIPFIPEVIGGGVAEALEDLEGGVESAARALLKRIEGELGGESIESYLA